MDSDNHISLTDLINKLSDDLESVNSVDASKEKVQEMLALSRELHERLTVLRFKDFEAATNDDTLDVEESDEAQIDLIDSIKEVSLAEKHQQKPLSSVREGLTILERANYTSILFSNDASSFNDVLDDVDLCSHVDDAPLAFRDSINPNGRKEEVQLAMKTFEDRIPRISS